MGQGEHNAATLISAKGWNAVPAAGGDAAVDQGYSQGAPMILVGAPGALPELSDANGARLVAILPLDMALDHIGQMVRLDILWLVAQSAATDEAALIAVMEAAAARGCELICETSLTALDMLMALVPAGMTVQWLVTPDTMDRQLALAAALPVRRMAVHDPARNEAMERIDRLQEEVTRISRLLGQLAGDARPALGLGDYGVRASELSGSERGEQLRAPPRSFRPMAKGLSGDEQSSDREKAKRARRLIRQRRMREQFFPADLFADPAWDMLLDLYAARLERQAVSVSSLCIAAAVPATTALRWIKTLTDSGMFVREADALDGRRIFIAMSDKAFSAVERYFEAYEE